MTPSLASRPAFFEAVAAPFLRRMVSAWARSPLASTRAFLQSIMPALVISRSFFTRSGETSVAAGAGVALGITGLYVLKMRRRAFSIEDRRVGGRRGPYAE